jgi:hypothetical protein
MLENLYDKWNKLAPFGLLIIGFGLSITGDAMISKAKGRGWFLKGTLGLIVFNAGIAVFGEAIKTRSLYEAELNRLKKRE